MSKSSDKKVTNIKKYSPTLSSKKANDWYYTNIDKPYFNGGLTEAQLDNAIASGLSNGLINNNDVDKILKTFGM